MDNLFIIIFFITLFYISISARLFSIINLLIVQGLVLFGVAIIELHSINIINLIVVLVETLVFKAFFMPYYLKRMITKNNIKRQVSPFISGFRSLIIVTFLIIASIVLSYYLKNNKINALYFAAAFSGIVTGLFLIVSRKEIIIHLIAYTVLENGIVLLSFAVGSEMPLAVNAGILLDILISVLIFGLLFNKIRTAFDTTDISKLESLTD